MKPSKSTPFRSQASIAAAFLAAWFTYFAASTAFGADVIKANNSDNLSLTTSWVGGVAPASIDVAKWNSTVTSSNTTVLNADVTWAGISIENPSGPVAINAGNTLTLGAAPIDLDLSTATADLTLNCPLALSAANSWSVAALRTLTLGGQISGEFAVDKLGTGAVILSSAANSYTGNTTVSAGTLQLSASDVIPNGAGTGNVVLGGTLDLNGKSETVNGLSGTATGIIDNTAAATTSTLTVGTNDQGGTFSGILKNSGSGAKLNLVKTGTGAIQIAGTNTLSGAVTINGGTLIVGSTGNLSPLASITGLTIADGAALRPDVESTDLNAPIAFGALGITATITAITSPLGGGANTSAKTFTLGGVISGAGNVTFKGVNPYNWMGVIVLNKACTYTGSTLMTTSNELAPPGLEANQNIVVRLGVDNALPTTTVLTLDGGVGVGSGRSCDLVLNGKNQTLAGLTNNAYTLRNQRILNSFGSLLATLTVNNSADFVYSGRIGGTGGGLGGTTDGNNLALTKSGTGMFTVSGANTYTGATTINGGTLALGASNVLANTTAVSIGTANLNAATFTDTVGTLDVAGAATINLGTGAKLAFASSSSIDWTGGTLNLTGTFVSGSSLRFGTTNGGLTPAQLALISATGFTSFSLDGNGYLTATATGGYSNWKTANSTSQAIDLDHDSDGVSNGVEYFLGGSANTTGFTALPGVTNTAGTPSVTWTKAAGYTGTYGTDFRAETSSTLTGVWTPAALGAGANQVDIITIPGNVKYTFPAGTRNFVRLKVTGP